MAAPEAMGEFHAYNGDCVWAATLMAAHKLNPIGWPLDYNLLDLMVQQAQAARIGVGAEGQAGRQQLEYMLNAWGCTYTNAWQHTSAIPEGTLRNILLDAFALGRPVLLGFSNGQALPGDERGLQGHEIAALRWNQAGTAVVCGDGDNQTCIKTGQAVTYTLSNLTAARCDSAYVLLTVPNVNPINGAGGIGGPTGGSGTTFLATPSAIAYKATANDGFLPLMQALDDAEQFESFDIANPVGTIVGNILPFMARLIIVLFGVALVIGALSWYWRATLRPAGDEAASIAALAGAVAA